MPEEESRPWPWRLWRSMGRTESAEQMAFKVAHASRLGAVGSVLGSVHGDGVGWGGVGTVSAPYTFAGVSKTPP
jgi:hypothetical protein